MFWYNIGHILNSGNWPQDWVALVNAPQYLKLTRVMWVQIMYYHKGHTHVSMGECINVS